MAGQDHGKEVEEMTMQELLKISEEIEAANRRRLEEFKKKEEQDG